MKRSFALLLASLVLTAGACKRCSFESPEFETQSVDVRSVSLEGIEFDLLMSVKNPNVVSVYADRISYVVKLEGQEVARGARQDRAEVPGGDTRQVRLPMRAKYEDIDSVYKRLLGKKKWKWSVAGKVGFDSPAGEVSLPFETHSELIAPVLPTVTVANPIIKKVDLRGAVIHFDVLIKNNNSFDLPEGRAELDIEIAGQKFSITPVDVPSIKERSQQKITVKHRLASTEIKAALMRLFAKPRIETNLSGLVKIGPLQKKFRYRAAFTR